MKMRSQRLLLVFIITIILNLGLTNNSYAAEKGHCLQSAFILDEGEFRLDISGKYIYPYLWNSSGKNYYSCSTKNKVFLPMLDSRDYDFVWRFKIIGNSIPRSLRPNFKRNNNQIAYKLFGKEFLGDGETWVADIDRSGNWFIKQRIITIKMVTPKPVRDPHAKARRLAKKLKAEAVAKEKNKALASTMASSGNKIQMGSVYQSDESGELTLCGTYKDFTNRHNKPLRDVKPNFVIGSDILKQNWDTDDFRNSLEATIKSQSLEATRKAKSEKNNKYHYFYTLNDLGNKNKREGALECLFNSFQRLEDDNFIKRFHTFQDANLEYLDQKDKMYEQMSKMNQSEGKIRELRGKMKVAIENIESYDRLIHQKRNSLSGLKKSYQGNLEAHAAWGIFVADVFRPTTQSLNALDKMVSKQIQFEALEVMAPVFIESETNLRINGEGVSDKSHFHDWITSKIKGDITVRSSKNDYIYIEDNVLIIKEVKYLPIPSTKGKNRKRVNVKKLEKEAGQAINLIHIFDERSLNKFLAVFRKYKGNKVGPKKLQNIKSNLLEKLRNMRVKQRTVDIVRRKSFSKYLVNSQQIKENIKQHQAKIRKQRDIIAHNNRNISHEIQKLENYISNAKQQMQGLKNKQEEVKGKTRDNFNIVLHEFNNRLVDSSVAESDTTLSLLVDTLKSMQGRLNARRISIKTTIENGLYVKESRTNEEIPITHNQLQIFKDRTFFGDSGNLELLGVVMRMESHLEPRGSLKFIRSNVNSVSISEKKMLLNRYKKFNNKSIDEIIAFIKSDEPQQTNRYVATRESKQQTNIQRRPQLTQRRSQFVQRKPKPQESFTKFKPSNLPETVKPSYTKKSNRHKPTADNRYKKECSKHEMCKVVGDTLYSFHMIDDDMIYDEISFGKSPVNVAKKINFLDIGWSIPNKREVGQLAQASTNYDDFFKLQGKCVYINKPTTAQGGISCAKVKSNNKISIEVIDPGDDAIMILRTK
jgi:hypothetical protein